MLLYLGRDDSEPYMAYLLPNLLVGRCRRITPSLVAKLQNDETNNCQSIRLQVEEYGLPEVMREAGGGIVLFGIEMHLKR